MDLIESEKNLIDHLTELTKDDWEKLFQLIPIIDRTKEFSKLIPSKKNPDGTLSMFHKEESSVVDKFRKVAYELGLVFDFYWSNWKQGEDILYNPNQDFKEIDTLTICKLFTVFIRNDRFNEGFLANYFSNGAMLKILRTLKENIDRSLPFIQSINRPEILKKLFSAGLEGGGFTIFLLENNKVVEKGGSGGILDENEDPHKSWENEYENWDEWWNSFMNKHKSYWFCFYPTFVDTEIKPLIKKFIDDYFEQNIHVERYKERWDEALTKK